MKSQRHEDPAPRERVVIKVLRLRAPLLLSSSSSAAAALAPAAASAASSSSSSSTSSSSSSSTTTSHRTRSSPLVIAPQPSLVGLPTFCPPSEAAGLALFARVASELSKAQHVTAASAAACGIFGECTPGTYIAYAQAWRRAGLGRLQHFHHLGSGLGVSVFAALLVGGAGSATGVEFNEFAVASANQVRQQFELRGAAFACGSYMPMPPVDMQGRAFIPIPPAARFLYAFDKNYAPALSGGHYVGDSRSLRYYIEALNAHSRWTHIHTCVPAETWLQHGLKGSLQVVETLKGMQKGSGSQYPSAILRRTL